MTDTSPVSMEDVFQACEKGNLSRLMEIMERTGTNFVEHDSDGNDVLFYASRSENAECARYLVERGGFYPLRSNRKGITPYDEAKRLGRSEVLDYYASVTGFRYEDGYHNPVQRGFFPDPSCIRVGDDYYMVNSTFHMFPCIPVSHSTDLVHWKIIGYAITDPEWSGIADKDGGRGYWAPDISYSDGRFYITATLRGNEGDKEKRVQMVTSSTRPEGPYDEPGWIHEDGIDSSIFHDDDGRKYMLINRGARIFELSPDCRRKISEAKMLWYGECKKNPEGPHLLKKDGWYYLFLAEGGTGEGHRVTVARSRTIMGVYERCPYNPIVRQNDGETLLQCCGHGIPVSSPDGRWYMVYLTLRKSPDGWGFTGRESCMDEMEWTPDGWPLVNRGRGPCAFGKTPDDTKSTTSFDIRRVFPYWKEREWMSVRYSDGSIFEKDGNLHIAGKGYDLNERDCHSILVERQKEFTFSAETEVEIPTLAEGESLGLTCYYDENSFIEFGVTVKDKRYGLMLKAFRDESFITDEFAPLPDKPSSVTLSVSADGSRRTFSSCGMSFTLEDTSYLSSEGLRKGKRFTGATVGLYVKGHVEGVFRDWKSRFSDGL